MAVTCRACGRESPDGFRFCGSCGAELAVSAGRREVRKTVTVVFCDVTGSTALGERLDPEAVRRTMGRYFEGIRGIVERHGGTVEKFIGDAVMAVFGIPVAHEDDALRAVRAVAEIRERLGVLREELSVALSFRTGVNTGEVVAGSGETLVTGDAVNVAARLEQASAPGEILIGAATLALVRDAVSVESVAPLELKGKSEPVQAFRLLSVDVTADAFKRQLDAPLVGRVREQQRLRADFDGVVSERVCHLFTLLGAAGVGKSRLVAEFLADVGNSAEVLHGRCLHYGQDITYWPLVEMLIAIGVEPDAVIGSSPAETQLAFRKLLEARAAGRPQIVVLDDIQWAEPVFLDLVEHVADWSRDAPIFLLCVARPELLEARQGWGGGKLNATTILLEALSGEDCELLVSRLAGGDRLSEDARRRILAAADGNPLFIEEMLALVGEQGEGAAVVVPPTIQALLQSRLDRLGTGERDVVGRGAVEGQVFHHGPVSELAPEPERDEVATHLLSLVRKELIRPEQATFPDDEAFRFRHLLIRDAAYDSLPKEVRADLHERFADWLDAHATLVEQDEIVGYHLEQAHRNRAELDRADPRLEPLARRAATRLEAAARGAERRGDVNATRGLVERAVALLPEGDSQRLGALLLLARALDLTGRPTEVRAVAAELAASTEARFRAFAPLVERWADLSTGRYDAPRSQAAVDAARAIFEELGDELGLLWTEEGEMSQHWMGMRYADAAPAAERAEQHARAAGEDVIADALKRGAFASAAFGPAHVDELLPRAQELLAEEAAPIAGAYFRRIVGRLLAMRGELDRAREYALAANDALREAGLVVDAAVGVIHIAFVERRAGRLDAAEAALRRGVEELDRLGGRSYYGTTALYLADTLARRGAYDETATWCASVREVLNEDDLSDVIVLDALEGFLTARGGAHAEGERRSRRAVDIAATTDSYEATALASEWHARTLALLGKVAEAREAATAALAICEAKGDRPAAASTRELLDSLT